VVDVKVEGSGWTRPLHPECALDFSEVIGAASRKRRCRYLARALADEISDSEEIMWRHFAVLVIFAFLAGSVSAQETKNEQGTPAVDQKLSAEIVSRKNPVPSTASSIAEAKKVFTVDCVMCHGPEGDGKGELAVSMKLILPDYRDETVMKKFTDGELFYIITNGKGGMPAEGKRATPEQIWNLVNYVRSFSQKKSPSPAK
jgi:mono/diheme cytochrome c family protein